MISSNVRLQLPIGYQFHAQFKKGDNSISNIGQLFQEFKMRRPLILVICYKGNGNFLVRVFNDGHFESEYGGLRNIARAPVYVQGTIQTNAFKCCSFKNSI